ncbi:MAG: hypothetical protein NZ960_06010 [Candidatus Kapabacteria bacterium]|nr:hypothetical protein [Candidatus Kapabacteria bacterium]MDW8012530.1 hypothetical protein [Bacteroidota bacterium]
MKVLLVGLCTLVLSLGGCATATDVLQTPWIRIERDVYTIIVRDTVRQTHLLNPPGEADRGILFPNARHTTIEHTATFRDSTVERHYPNFIRLGVFESVGLLGTAPSDEAYDSGLFGLFPEALEEQGEPSTDSRVFTGAWRRFGILEYRFPWFYGARHWSVGSVSLEVFQLSRQERSWFIGVLPLYICKRWYFRELPPYVTAAVSLGTSLFPSQYLNLTGSLELGSLGGVNLRGYVGFLWGQTPARQGQNEGPIGQGQSEGSSTAQLYAGLGTSLLDFLNREEELQQEWSEHRHSAWSVGIGHGAFLRTSASQSIWTEGSSPLISGLLLRVMPVQLALPLRPQGFYLGTSLTTILILGMNQGAIGILPLRAGYWFELVPAGLYGDLGAEALYYPSNAVNLSARLILRLSEIANIFLTAGFTNGSVLRGREWWDILNDAGRFSGWYIGIGTGAGERLFRPSEVWYFRSPSH